MTDGQKITLLSIMATYADLKLCIEQTSRQEDMVPLRKEMDANQTRLISFVEMLENRAFQRGKYSERNK